MIFLHGEYVYQSIKRLEQSIFIESYSHPCARAFRHNFQISNFTSAFIFTLVQNMEGPNKRYRCWMCAYPNLSITGICDEMDVPLWSECRQRNVIRQRILIHHKKEITSALIWKKRAAIWIRYRFKYIR